MTRGLRNRDPQGLARPATRRHGRCVDHSATALWNRLALSAARRDRRVYEVVDASLHDDGDGICPDCLQWISPDEYLRRNVVGILEHEVCPPASVRRHR